MSAPRDQFDPSRLPGPEMYFGKAEGLTLHGHGDWRTALCVFHEDSKPSLALHLKTGGFKCFACGTKGTDVLAFYMERHGVNFKTAARALGAWIEKGGKAAPATATPSPARAAPARAPAPQQERLADRWLRFYEDECLQSIGGVPLSYLETRHCVIPPADGDLRWHPKLRHRPSGYVGPGLVALVTHAVTREPMTLHFTWTNSDGTKAPIEPARMLLGGHRKSGGVIRLWPDEAVTAGLGIAEGIETALSLAHAFTPVWACIDAGNLAAFALLNGIEALTIAADHDEAGVSAAEACAVRWAGQGCEARIVVPEADRTDLNDVARAA